MKRSVFTLLVFASLPQGQPLAAAAPAPPDWAYPPSPLFEAPPEDGVRRHVPDSTKAYTAHQVDDVFNPPDWYPNEHPPMPQVVAHGRMPDVNACAQCHLSMGYGHPESANVAGLPVEYFEEQVHAFASGERASLLPSKTGNMVRIAKGLNADEIRQAATYFASIKPIVWTRVVETDTAPKSHLGAGGMRFVVEGGGTEPLGRRIIEVPQDTARAKLRDPHSPFIAYVPKGSIKAGEALATTGGGGKTLQCSICHGVDYKGIGKVPTLTGHSAIYIFRQLNDIQKGSRHGNAVALMQPVVANLSDDDKIALAAFLSSRVP